MLSPHVKTWGGYITPIPPRFTPLADIHPYKMCTVSNDKVLVSGGLLSEYSYLNNYYQCDLRYDSTDYPTLEHAYSC